MPCDGKTCEGNETCENKDRECVCKEGLLFDEDEDDCLGKFSCFSLIHFYLSKYVKIYNSLRSLF